MIKRYLIYLLFSMTVVNMFAQSQLCVKRQRKGYVVSRNINNREVVLMRSDRGTFDSALQSNTVFRHMVDAWKNIPESTVNGVKCYALIDDGTGVSFPDYVEPLCTSIWEQYSEPYVWQTPLINGEHCCVGCVPLALAQVLHYYKYPTTGTGSHEYYDSIGCKQTLSADFSAHTYEYDYMLDSYDGINYSNRQGNAIAQLVSDCGVAVNARYGVGSTAANTIYQAIALVDYFGYDRSSLQMYYRDYFKYSEWHSMLHRELAEGRPILISAWNSNGGHAFLIDGYDETGLYHINFGLGGECDGYYNIDYMSPDQPEWDRFKDSPERGNNLYQLVIVGIKPKDISQPEYGSESHVFTFSKIKGQVISESPNQFQIITSHLVNMGWNMFSDSVVLALCDTRRQIVSKLYEYPHQFSLFQITEESFSDTLTCDLSSQANSLDDGVYQIIPMFKDNDGWREAVTSVGVPNYLNATLQNGVWSLSQPQIGASEISISDMVFPDVVYHRLPPHFSFSVTNNSDNDYNGRILLELYPVGVTDRTQLVYKQVAIQGLYLKAGETQYLDYKYTPLQISPGEYTLHVLCDMDLFTDSLVEVYTSDDIITVEPTPTAVGNIQSNESSLGMYYDLSGRKLSPADIRRQPIIVKKANKTRKVLRK